MNSMYYTKVPEEYTFSTEFSTWIIAYCIDTNSWFCTNRRFFYYEYGKEFQSESDAIEYFRNNVPEFYELSCEICSKKINSIFFENTGEEYRGYVDFSKAVKLDELII